MSWSPATAPLPKVPRWRPASPPIMRPSTRSGEEGNRSTRVWGRMWTGSSASTGRTWSRPEGGRAEGSLAGLPDRHPDQAGRLDGGPAGRPPRRHQLGACSGTRAGRVVYLRHRRLEQPAGLSRRRARVDSGRRRLPRRCLARNAPGRNRSPRAAVGHRTGARRSGRCRGRTAQSSGTTCRTSHSQPCAGHAPTTRTSPALSTSAVPNSYRVGDLKKWARNRPRAASGTTDPA